MIDMTMIVPNPNVLLAQNEDKLGHLLIELKTRLVATGLWRVRGSGTGGADGNSTFQLMGQTAGIAGSFDVFTASPAWIASGNWYTGGAGSISRSHTWYVLEEIGSGRCLTIRRADSSGGQSNGSTLTYIHFSLGGVATSGANATTPPAQVAPTAQLLLSGGNLGNELITPPTAEIWMQMGVETTAQAGGVCPFWWAIFSRSSGSRMWGMLYESMLDAVVGDAHPFVIGTAAWAWIFGDLFGSSQRLFGGAALAARGLGGYSAGNVIFPYSAAPQPIGGDGYWRTSQPWVTENSPYKVFGRCQHLLMHPIPSRDYPTTYNVATPNAKLVLGQLLVPWAQGVAPGGNP